MARFLGRCSGERGEATRLGHQSMHARADGLQIGGNVFVQADPDGPAKCKECDTVSFDLTRGSKSNPSLHIAQATVDPTLGAITITLYNPETGKELGTWTL